MGWPNWWRSFAYWIDCAERELYRADGAGAELQAADVQDVESDLVAAPYLAQNVFNGHAAVFEHQRRRRRPVDAELLLFVPAHQPRPALYEEGRELLAVNFGEDREQVGEAAVGDPHLLAV